MSQVIEELKECDLLCVSCHALEHFGYDRFLKYKMEIDDNVNNIEFKPVLLEINDVLKIQKLADDGLGINEIGRKTGFSVINVRRSVRKDQKFGNNKIRKITDEQLIEERNADKSLRKIALEYDMSYKVVWKRWDKILNKRKKMRPI